MLIKFQEALLLLIDVQQKLIPHIANQSQLLENCQWLLEFATAVKLPIVATEQYPQGLSETPDFLKKYIPASNLIKKVAFSCCEDTAFCSKINNSKAQQIIVCGIEAHICVLMTVLQLLAQNKQVFVVAEAVGSRNAEDKKLALKRMRQNGAQIVSREMVFFEILRSKDHPQFKALSDRFIKNNNN